MGILDRDYTKDKLREQDDRNSKNNGLLYLAIAIGIGFLIYLFLR
ncbi:MAG TPA: hypothetical protein VJJ80_01655 [Patescibacteria group bacterium]|nr:hypothetical protein [Patescibacteria group bacterium]